MAEYELGHNNLIQLVKPREYHDQAIPSTHSFGSGINVNLNRVHLNVNLNRVHSRRSLFAASSVPHGISPCRVSDQCAWRRLPLDAVVSAEMLDCAPTRPKPVAGSDLWFCLFELLTVLGKDFTRLSYNRKPLRQRHIKPLNCECTSIKSFQREKVNMSERDEAKGTGAPPSTKERLATIVQGFDTFDSEMKVGTRQRREKDEFKIAELKAEMKRLDGDLVAEIKRRTEMNKSTQMWFEGQLSELNRSFHATLEERTVKTTLRLEVLEENITALDVRFEKEKAMILQEIDDRGRELARLLNEFKDEFERERVLRLEREEKLIKQLTDQEYVTNERFENQIQTRETRYAAIRVILEDNIKLRDKAEERFQSFFEREIHKLHNDVRAEVEVRLREDDEIVEALNRYTMKLQTSLKIINATDM